MLRRMQFEKQIHRSEIVLVQIEDLINCTCYCCESLYGCFSNP